MMAYKWLVSVTLLSIFLISAGHVSAQRAGQCGGVCNPGCVAGNTCNSGICVQTSCSTSNPCCRVITRTPRTPTTPPSGGGPIVPVPGTTGSFVDPLITKPASKTPSGPILPITPPVGGGATGGDCSGLTEGTPDGKVDLLDFNLLRKESSGVVTTAKCDFDANLVVDLLDFNILRIALIAQK